MLEFNKLYLMDCMDGMKQFPDKYFDWGFSDPPYFTGPNKRRFYGREVNKLNIKRIDYPVIKNWDIPGKEFFDELIRVSKNQIIWGCNYFNYHFGHGRIVWDKVNDSSSFSDCEIACCSLHDSVRIFRYMWNGMMQGKSITEGHIMQGDKSLNEKRIHPCQKPVKLYEWQLMKYASHGHKILNTHVGSASDMIACYNLGFDCIGFEIDENIYNLAQQRIDGVKSQVRLNI